MNLRGRVARMQKYATVAGLSFRIVLVEGDDKLPPMGRLVSWQSLFIDGNFILTGLHQAALLG